MCIQLVIILPFPMMPPTPHLKGVIICANAPPSLPSMTPKRKIVVGLWQSKGFFFPLMCKFS